MSTITAGPVTPTRPASKDEEAKPITFKNLSKNGLKAGSDQFTAKGLTWVTGQKLPNGITPVIADHMYHDAVVRRTVEKMYGGSPPRKKFWCLEDLTEEAKIYKIPLSRRDQARSTEELQELADDEVITFREAVRLGLPLNHLLKHCDKRKRRKPPLPSPILNRVVRGGYYYSVDAAGKRRRRVGVVVGDVRAYVKAVGELTLPDGAILLRDALPKLKALGIDRDVTTIVNLIKAGTIEGGKISGIINRRRVVAKSDDRKASDLRMWWMKWEDHKKIRRYEAPGSRVCWSDGKDWHPASHEAWRLAGCGSQGELWQWLPPEWGGRGKPCPYLSPPQTVRCAYGSIAHRRGDELVVCAGDDLRGIAEKKTGKRPPAPKKPMGANVTLRFKGNGDADRTPPGSSTEQQPPSTPSPTGGKGGRTRAAPKGPPTLNDAAKRVKNFIDKNHGQGGDYIATQCGISPAYFRRIMSKKLSWYGYHNPQKTGYFPPENAKSL